jgi:xanthine/uracil permease
MDASWFGEPKLVMPEWNLQAIIFIVPESCNPTTVALIPDCGIGGRVLPFGEFTLGGIGLSGIIGVVLNLMLPAKR